MKHRSIKKMTDVQLFKYWQKLLDSHAKLEVKIEDVEHEATRRRQPDL